MTERTFFSQSAGPVVLGLGLPMGSVTVQVLDSITTARVELRTADPSGPAADAVSRARGSQDGQAFAVEVPEIPSHVITQSFRGNRVTQSMHTVYGSVTGITIVNGRIINGGSADTMTTVSPIEARVILPVGSSLAVVSQSADTVVHGDLDRMEFRSVSGGMRADGVRSLTASTTSGDILTGRVAERITARSVSGSLAVNVYSGCAAELDTTSGNVSVRATSAAYGAVRANSVSGDVDISAGSHLRVSAHSVSGRVCTR
ncbi:DUF4097 family beta strand repeat-containing protein [Streptomyces syringium]|uniref:DUF4097 family beta strand repeat-containing protein n=1 Tax=Streptomyces syringium TaxID=76729 RepID=UPI003448DEAF